MFKLIKNIKHANNLGFSLVELSVVLTIVGITLAGAIDLATYKSESDRVTETNMRLDAIEEALELFVINNRRLPCPADASLATSHASYGVEGTASSGGCSVSNFSSGNIYYGTVPVKTLGISDKNMADDWERRFTYVVDARFTNNITAGADGLATNSSCDGTSDTYCFKYAPSGSITVKDSAGANRTTTAVYVLISHGKNGYGAYKYVGSATQLPNPLDADEQDNAGNAEIGYFDTIFVQKDTTSTFDDIVRYKEKSLIISDVNGITDSTTCVAAKDAVNNTTQGTYNVSFPADPCPGATSTANCYAMATQINNLCLQP